MKKIVEISVRNLIEFVMRSGDIDNRFRSINRLVEGTRAHQKIQKEYGENYRSEVALKYNFPHKGYQFEIEGRADGIYRFRDEAMVDEIKSTSYDLDDIEEESNPTYWAQAKIYAYIYAGQEDLESIDVQITYFNIETEKTKLFKKEYSIEELEDFFNSIIKGYISWAELSFGWESDRDESIEKLDFPFKSYRKGQRELAVAVYKTILEKKKLFAKAPTGIGKTVSTLFPSLKAMLGNNAKKIFYLTAKTITRQAPIKTISILMDGGLKLKSIVITAKDKICLNDVVKCNPRDCEFAKGHFDRVNDAIMDIFLNENLIDREKVKEYSLKHRVCPFEFQLDVSLWMDVIICDYNYAFDPQVYLKRFFEGMSSNYVFLIDEAHNLVDRSREMFSASLNSEDFKGIQRVFNKKNTSIYKKLVRIENIFNNIERKEEITDNFKTDEEYTEFYFPLKGLLTSFEPWLAEWGEGEDYEKVIDVYFDIVKYLKISELFDSNYVTEIEKEEEGLELKLFCVNPASLLRQSLKRGASSTFFSATLTPIDYYKDLLGGLEDDYHMRLSSPFPRKNLELLLRDNISTRYKDREKTYIDVVECIKAFIESKKGNYIIFFPSYYYMEKIYELIEYDGLNIALQERDMKEENREDFLNLFKEEDDLVAFSVVGGMFSEGIDLVGDQLIGAAIIGVGLPGINFERDIVKEYFNSKNGKGFDYAYTYPGINKVLQAGGRVIRTEEDRGAILLIDDRFGSPKYKRLLPKEWSDSKKVRSDEELKAKLMSFWNRN